MLIPLVGLDMSETPTLDAYRTGYIAERHDLTDNAAKAIQLFELGYTTSAVARALGVTQGTVKKYQDRIAEAVGESALYPVTDESRKHLDIWGDRDISEYESAGYEKGVADAEAQGKGDRPAVPKDLIAPRFRERERPLRQDVAFADIFTAT